MIGYEVTLELGSALADELEEYMRREHIPDIFRTGCFTRIHFERASSTRFRTRYEAWSQNQLDRYFRDHAPRLRSAFQARFPAGITIGREMWTSLESWE